MLGAFAQPLPLIFPTGNSILPNQWSGWVGGAHNKARLSNPTKCTALSSFRSDSVFRSMWMVVLGQPMTFSVLGSRNRSIFRLQSLYDARKTFFHAEKATLHTSFFAFPFVCRSDDVVSIFLPSGSFSWHEDDQMWFGDQHLTCLSFVVEFAYRLRPTVLAIRRLGTFSAGPGDLLSFKSKSPLLNCLNQRTHASCVRTLSP